MKMGNVSMQMVPGTLSMRSIKKININEKLEVDKTGHKKGKILLNRLSENLSTDEVKSYFIKFEKGSKSKIHLHDSDQIIIGMAGVGKIVIFSKVNDDKESPLEIEKDIELKQGEAILIPSGKLHWHGSTAQSSSQLSFMKNGQTFWF